MSGHCSFRKRPQALVLACFFLPLVQGQVGDFGAPVTKIVSNDLGDIFVGGHNFLAQLTSDLQIFLMLAIGPVTEPSHCFPNSAPCNNTVQVMEIDNMHNSLLVCGSAYQGTCTLHSIFSLSSWLCVGGDKAQYIGGEEGQTTVVHFINFINQEEPVTDFSDSPGDQWSCRDVNFSTFSYGGRSGRALQNAPCPNGDGDDSGCEEPSVDNGNTYDNSYDNYDVGDLKPIVSYLYVAGNTYQGDPYQGSVLSLRKIRDLGMDTYNISFVSGLSQKPIRLDVRSTMRDNFDMEYKLSFTHQNMSYFLAVQRTKCDPKRVATINGECMVTLLSRVCHLSGSVAPYVEVPLSCEHNSQRYGLLTSATFGKVGLQLKDKHEEIPILVVAFGNGTEPLSKYADPKYGTAVCVFALNTLDTDELDGSFQMCELNIGAGVSTWVEGSPEKCKRSTSGLPKGSDRCDARENPYVRGGFEIPTRNAATFFLKDTVVPKVLTHTQRYTSHGELILAENMNVFLVSSTGSILKFGVRVRKDNKRYVPNPDKEYTKSHDLGESVPFRRFPPVGITDSDRAVMYLAYENKVRSLELDFCRQYRTCSECTEQKDKCRWCTTKSTCLESSSPASVCPGTSESKCPPRVDVLYPTEFPTEGGTFLTITGDHLGNSKESGDVIVSICEQHCIDVRATDKQIVCKVPRRCSKDCPSSCPVTVHVDQKGSGGKSTTPVSLYYVTPVVLFMTPSSGPVSGGTAILFEGEHLLIGSTTSIKVNGRNCEKLEVGSDLKCRVAGTEQPPSKLPDCGKVVLSIDGFRTRIGSFCFQHDPEILSLTPLATIKSGGINIDVTGRYLNVVRSPFLILKTVPHLNTTNPATYKVRCNILENGNKLICKTPDLTYDATSKLDLFFDLDGLKSVQSFPGLEDKGQMTVHPDPRLLVKEKKLYLRQKTFTIDGWQIPDWLDPSEIIVKMGKTRCNILRLTRDEITISTSAIIEAYKVDLETAPPVTDGGFNNPTTADPSHPSSNNGTTPDRQNTWTTNIEDVASTAAAFSSETGQGSALHRYKRSLNDTGDLSNDTEATNSTLGTGSTTTPATDGVKTTDGSGGKTGRTLPYQLEVSIGNFREVIATILVGPRAPIRPPAGDTEELFMNDYVKIAIGAGAGAVVLVLCLIIGCTCWRRHKDAERFHQERFYMGSFSGRGSQPGSSERSVPPNLRQVLEEVLDPSKRSGIDHLVVSLDRLLLGKTIGSGNFGCVYEGMLTSEDGKETYRVAVKTLQDPSSHQLDLKGFVQEAVIMKDFCHPNVLGLIGLAEKEAGVPYVILPYMDNGDLLTYVRDPTVNLSLHDVIKFGADIASGMAYLSVLKFVHRDLAARNCMLDSYRRVKVADFGLCRDVYEKGYYTSDNRKKLPIRWMAVESIEHGAYSTKSDVWSLGVVLWELLTRGVTPYPGVDGWDIINFLRRRRLAIPFFCPDNMYKLMMNCWAKDPQQRPTFRTIQRELLLLIGQSPPVTPQLTRADLSGSPPSSPSNDSCPGEKDGLKAGANTVPQIQLTGVGGKEKELVESDNSKKTAKAKGQEGQKAEAKIQKGVSIPKKNVINNILITIPACYDHRDINNAEMATYLQLVDSYEPPPKFNNPLLRPKAKPKKSDRKKQSSSKELSVGYSVPYDMAMRSSSGLDDTRDSVDSIPRSYIQSGGAYFELELNRSSAVSDASSSVRSSDLLNRTISSNSLLDAQDNSASRNSASQDSTGSRLSVSPSPRRPVPAPRPRPQPRKSPLARQSGVDEELGTHQLSPHQNTTGAVDTAL